MFVIILLLLFATNIFWVQAQEKGISHTPSTETSKQPIVPVNQQTAAGILVYSIDPETKEPVLLLGERDQESWWDSFGGAHDVREGTKGDQTLADTASREVLEESMGIFHYIPMDLQKFPSHDVRNEDGTIYRMYIAPHDYVPAEIFKKRLQTQTRHEQREHVDFKWVPIKDILSHLGQTATPEEKKKKTRILYQGKDEQPLILFPPFAKMLSQESVKKILQQILKKQKIAALHTQSSDIDSHWKTQSTPSPEHQLAETVTKHGSVMAEIKSKYPQPMQDPKLSIHKKERLRHLRGKADLNEEDQKKLAKLTLKSSLITLAQDLKNLPYTQTQAYLSLVMGDDYQQDQDVKDLIRTFLQKYSLQAKTLKSLRNEDDPYFNTLIQAFLEEISHKDFFAFYHATDPIMGFIYDIYSEFRAQLMLESSEDRAALRGLDKHFAQYFNVENLIQSYTQKHGFVHNYQEGYQDVGLSTNLFLFGSDNLENSATYRLFYNSESISPPDYEKLFNNFMTTIGFESRFSDFQPIFENYLSKNNGRLYQIFISPLVVDQMAYTSIQAGFVLNFGINNQINHSITEPVSVLRNNPSSFKDLLQKASSKGSVDSSNLLNPYSSQSQSSFEINDVQARLYLKPEYMFDPKYVHMKTYWRYPLSSDKDRQYRQKIHKLVQQNLARWLASQVKTPEKTFYKEPKLQKLHEYAYEGIMGKKLERQSSAGLFPIYIQEGNLEALRDLLKEHPIDLNKPIHNTNYQSSKKNIVSPLKFAILSGQREIAEFLYDQGALLPDKIHFLEILKINSQKLMAALLERDPTIINSPGLLNNASVYSSVDMITYLLEKGADPNAQNIVNVPPLFDAVRLKRPDVIKLLCQYGANINQKRVGYDNDESLFFHAARHGATPVVIQTLMDQGLDLFEMFKTNSSSDSYTPLQYIFESLAVPNPTPWVPILRSFIEKGANVNFIIYGNQTMLDFLRSVANNSRYKIPEILALLEEKRRDPTLLPTLALLQEGQRPPEDLLSLIGDKKLKTEDLENLYQNSALLFEEVDLLSKVWGTLFPPSDDESNEDMERK